jgi:hypothetical protein
MLVARVGRQGCGSESQLDPDTIGSLDPDPDPGGQKLPTKVEKVLKISCFELEASFVIWTFFWKA